MCIVLPEIEYIANVSLTVLPRSTNWPRHRPYHYRFPHRDTDLIYKSKINMAESTSFLLGILPRDPVPQEFRPNL